MNWRSPDNRDLLVPNERLGVNRVEHMIERLRFQETPASPRIVGTLSPARAGRVGRKPTRAAAMGSKRSWHQG
jgi:hypothetical protein